MKDITVKLSKNTLGNSILLVKANILSNKSPCKKIENMLENILNKKILYNIKAYFLLKYFPNFFQNQFFL